MPIAAHSVSEILGIGSLLTLVGGSLFAWAKGLPVQVTNFVLNKFTVGVTIRDTDPLFPSVLLLSQKQENMKSCRRLLVESEQLNSDAWTAASLSLARNTKGRILFTRAPGKHVFRYKDQWVFFTRIVDDKKTGIGRNVEQIFMRTIGRNRSLLEALFAEAKSEVDKTRSNSLNIRVSNGEGQWSYIAGCGKRSLDSVVLRGEFLEKIKRDIEVFIANEDFYRSTGTPYHRGYLLEGPPGSGKSSLVQALATHFDKSLFVLCLNEIHSDAKLRQLVGAVPEDSFLLIEDVDASASTVSRKKDDSSEDNEDRIFTRGPSLAGFLNVLDGIFAKNKLLVFMTTNYPDQLDAALVRPGRIDMRIRLDNAVPEQAARLYQKFFPTASIGEANVFAEQTEGNNVSMASLQEQLIKKVLGGVV